MTRNVRKPGDPASGRTGVSPVTPESAPPAQVRLILASSSPRRAALMREYGYEVETIHPPHEEPQDFSDDVSPAQKAQALAYFKARSVAVQIDTGFILAGDTVAAVGRRVYGKPADRKDARRILSSLAGTTHQVITGVTLLDTATGARLIRHDSTTVTMKPLSPRELDDYLDTQAWVGKAGAYGIQDHRDAFVERIDGSFTNVVGFPMELIGRMLSQWGIQPALVD